MSEQKPKPTPNDDRSRSKNPKDQVGQKALQNHLNQVQENEKQTKKQDE